MRPSFNVTQPVIIGGVGGSGTRVVAEIINRLGVYIGSDIDSRRDNLWFTLLFKRPKWYQKARQNKADIFTGFRLLSNAMIHRSFPSSSELAFVLKAVFTMAVSGHNYLGDGRGFWPFVRAWKMLTARIEEPSNYIGWGWKEPNTHIFIDYMAEYFDQLKYIHTIRHGLDMAFSSNQQQLYNWGPVFGVDIPQSPSDQPKASLKYWVRANRRVLGIGEQLGAKKFLMINFDTLCVSPKQEIQRIVSFLNISPDPNDLDQVYHIPKKPKSFGRYQTHSLSQFDPVDLAALETFGYSTQNHVS